MLKLLLALACTLLIALGYCVQEDILPVKWMFAMLALCPAIGALTYLVGRK